MIFCLRLKILFCILFWELKLVIIRFLFTCVTISNTGTLKTWRSTVFQFARIWQKFGYFAIRHVTFHFFSKCPHLQPSPRSDMMWLYLQKMTCHMSYLLQNNRIFHFLFLAHKRGPFLSLLLTAVLFFSLACFFCSRAPSIGIEKVHLTRRTESKRVWPISEFSLL